MPALSIRLRLTLWYVLVLAVVLAVFSASVYVVLRRALYNNLDESIKVQSAALLSAVRYEGAQPILATQSSPVDEPDDERFVRVFDASRQVTFISGGVFGNVPVDSTVLNGALRGETTRRRVKVEDDDPLRVLTVPISREGQVVGVLQVGQSEEDSADILNTLLLIMGAAYPVTLLVAVAGGVFLARRALSPVDEITGMARRISAEDLSQRLDLQLPDDEIGRLARTFDDMIGRLDDAFRRQRQFTADASHELRTPLTIMKGQVDVALQKDRAPEEYRQVLQEVNKEVDRMVHLTGSLLTLTRADASQIALTMEQIGVAGLVEGAVDHLRSTADEKGVALRSESDGEATMRGDEGLLLQLLLNLLDNAIKYTPEGGQVTAGWSVSGNRLELWVRDTGIGITEEHIPHIFERFYRVDKARGRSEGGVGLGLAIGTWIAEAHGGSIGVANIPGEGTTFTVDLPGDL